MHVSPISQWFSGQLHDLPRASAHLLRARATRAAGDDCRAAAARRRGAEHNSSQRSIKDVAYLHDPHVC